MKRVLLMLILILAIFMYSCGGSKTDNPAPNNTGTTGSTGSTGSTGGGGNSPTVDVSNEYKYGVVTGESTVTDANHKFISAHYSIAGNGGININTGGTVTQTIKNLDQTKLTETFYNSNTTSSVLPTNISTGLSTVANIADTATLVYIEIKDPAEKDVTATSNRQIIHRYFMRSDGGSASGSFGFTTNTIAKPYTKGEATSNNYVISTLNGTAFKYVVSL